MRFAIPANTDLAVYFGRCLGAFVLIIEGLAFRAALTGVGIVFTFQVKPLTETVEIGFWILLLLLGITFFPIGTSV